MDMPAGALIFLVVLLIFAGLDVFLVVTLFHPGDERGQLMVWKAGSPTLLVLSLVLVLDVAHNMVTGQPEMVNPFTHLTITAIVYFCTLMYFRRKHGG